MNFKMKKKCIQNDEKNLVKKTDHGFYDAIKVIDW